MSSMPSAEGMNRPARVISASVPGPVELLEHGDEVSDRALGPAVDCVGEAYPVPYLGKRAPEHHGVHAQERSYLVRGDLPAPVILGEEGEPVKKGLELHGGTGPASRVSRTLRVKPSTVNGFCTKATPGSRTP